MRLNPVITAELKGKVNLTNLNFFRDSLIDGTLGKHFGYARTTRRGAVHQLRGAHIGAQSRLRVSVRPGADCVLPCRWLPSYRSGEIPKS